VNFAKLRKKKEFFECAPGWMGSTGSCGRARAVRKRCSRPFLNDEVNEMKKSSQRYVYESPLKNVTPRSPAPSAPTMPPSRPPGMHKDEIPGDDGLLQGGASPAPTAADRINPINGAENGVAPNPATGGKRPLVS
jgi:hypothetical protein